MSTFAKDVITGTRHTLKQLKHKTKHENITQDIGHQPMKGSDP